MSKITLVSNYNDWEGLYIEGILFMEEHKLEVPSVLRLLERSKVPVTEVSEVEAGEWLELEGSLPEELSDVHFKNIGE